MDVFKWRDTTYPTLFLKSIYEMQQLNIMCDITLIVGDELIPAHKLILCSVSPYFRAMLNTEAKETKENIVTFHEVTINTLREIVHFIYTGEIELNESNVFELMKTAHLYQIATIQPAISQYLLKSISTNNCLQSLAHAKLYGHEELVADILKFIDSYFCFIINKDVFLDCPEDVLNLILCQKSLAIESMLYALRKWLKYNSENTYDFQLFDGDICIDYINRIKLMDEDKLTRKKLLIDIKYVILNQLIASESVRNYFSYVTEQKTIFVVGGTSHGNVFPNSECLQNGEWSMWIPKYKSDDLHTEGRAIIPKMLTTRLNFGFAYGDQDIFLLGGSDASAVLSSCERYSTATNEWKYFNSLPSPRKYSAATMVNNVMYISGGVDSNETSCNDVWEYYEKSDRWTTCKPMQQARYYHGACSVRGVLYVMGGCSECGEVLSSIERYDDILRRWIYVSEMPESKSEFGCVAFNEYIYVMGGARKNFVLNSVHKYNTLKNRWETCADMPAPKCGFGCVITDDRVYCVGGSNLANGPLNSSDCYNPETNRWHCMRGLMLPRAYTAAAVSNIEAVQDCVEKMKTFA